MNIAPVAVMEVTPSAGMKTRGGRLSYGSLHETDAEGEDDDMLDEDVVDGDGRIEIVTTTAVPLVTTPSNTYKVRANRRRSLPTPAKKSAQLGGMIDPFALPEGDSIEVNGGATAVEMTEIQQFPQKTLKALKKRIMGKLTGRKPCKLVGVAEEEMHVRKLLEQTVVAGEGNSMLIIGARGSGKTTVGFFLLCVSFMLPPRFRGVSRLIGSWRLIIYFWTILLFSEDWILITRD